MPRRCEAINGDGGPCGDYSVPGSYLCRRHLAKRIAAPGVGAVGGAALGHLLFPGGIGAIVGVVLGVTLGSQVLGNKSDG
jgi:hypothetical protein